MRPGELIIKTEPVVLNPGRDTRTIKVTNTGDRPIQIGSHFHFFETNRDLEFDREKAYGYRLDLPAGTSARFEAGQTHDVNLVKLGGRRRVYGLNRLTEGQINEFNKNLAMQRVRTHGFKIKTTDKE